ncbi:MAG: TRAP transporter fused permease subunit, partial [Caldilineaceae bacterium]|nr:TRAP transporter fused permease subunit [Caldilineaceae bacterium]
AATYAFMFVLFGTFLSMTGGGDFFFNLAAAVSGRRTGGPAKIAVISSGMYGMLSGSSVSDVVTTGSITIPMMRKMGYSTSFAAATEVSASTGGSLMPPVMGAAAFIMVEYTGVSYPEIALSALVPALLYYLAVYTQVHLHSQKRDLVGMPPDQIPRLSATIREGWAYLIPLVILIIALALEYSPTYVALFGTSAVLALAVIRWRQSGFSLSVFYKGLSETTWRIITAAGACAAAGLVIAGLTVTGLSQKFAHLVYAMSDASLLPTLVIAAALTLVLGLGMPTVAAYILSVILIGPTLTGLGVPPLAAHMFVLYYAVLSALTPPVAVAAYAAAAIADGNPIQIAVAAVRLSLVAFVVPFAFVYGQELLLIGEPLAIAIAVITAVVGVIVLSIAAEGYFRRTLSGWVRIAVALTGLCFVFPSFISASVGVVLLFVLVFAGRIAERRRSGVGRR